MKESDFKNILFPTDFSKTSEYVLDYAISMTKKFNAKLYIIHVLDESIDVRGFYLPHLSPETAEKDMAKAAEKVLNRLCNLKLREVKDLETAVVEGIPHKEISKFIKDKSIDLLVMGTHSTKGIEHLIFGSITEKVLREVSCPVLTIRPPREVSEGEG